MKKTAFLLVFMLLSLIFCACNEDFDYLKYQRGDVRAYCTVNSKYEVIISKTSECSTLEITKPSELENIRFELYGERAYALSGEMKIPLDKSSFSGICALLGAFSLDSAQQSSVNDENGKSVVCFDTESGTYVITYGKNLMPSRIEIHSDNYDYDIVVKEIMLGDRI